MPLSQGQILNNRYRIETLLGQGGFGAVYRVWDTNLERPMALKENLDTSPEAQRQFKREAQILFDLSHPNLPKVIDCFIIPDQGQYLVMEFVEGEDLGEKLRLVGSPLPEARVLDWVGQVCDALTYLHNQNPPVIHRDIKPANIKVTPAGKVMLVDFGIAKLFDPELRTTVGARAVTPGYSPPEQYGRSATDAQSDIYALGATAYHLLTGQLPPDSIDVLSSSAAPLRPAHEVNLAVSPQVSGAVERAMQLNRANRWSSIAEFKIALLPSPLPPLPQNWERIRGGEEQTVVVQPATFLPQTVALEVAEPAPASRRRLWLGVGLGGLGLAGVVLLGLVVWGLSSLLGGRKPTQFIDAKGVPMALVPAGEFQMGSDNGSQDEKPVHTVYLDAFYMDVYEVTNARYAECVSTKACQPPTQTGSSTRRSFYSDAQYADYPVIYVTWAMAKAYCTWRGGNLPTEAQWEKAARGGLQGMDYPWGNEQPVCEKGAQNGANFEGCGSSNDTKAVGSYSPNGYGLFDLAGNVWEWVRDWYSESYYSSQTSFTNPFGPTSGDGRVVRGGSWRSYSILLRVADRFRNVPLYNYYDIGFRCSRAP
jgi:formylglycine-generating enzyme required for sulfatase activity